ncbi:hypothetical protein [Palaeococcus ferrophilus]|uniref:hypothetical protein n=1 Tax=Palaeococcus ferrophilus TaxID=83868 RepID=UPI00064FC935|nr:hypothetical protein [Palaeococcus ferrophilus]
MKRGVMLGVLLVGSLLVGLVNAASSVSAQSCVTTWDHNSDVREWSQDEWVWAGIHGQVLVCDGKFQRILTDTVYGTTTAKGMKDWYGQIRITSKIAYARVGYTRYNGETGTALADIPNYFR